MAPGPGEDGQYVDLIAKYSSSGERISMYATLYGHKLSGDYKTWGASLSAEYGKRFEGKNGLYVDPSVELTCRPYCWRRTMLQQATISSAWGKN